MQSLYLTPASISYLNQFLLALLITVYLCLRTCEKKRYSTDISARLLVAFFAGIALFSFLLFWEASVLPAIQLPIVYIENAVLGVVITLLLQFAYSFPKPVAAQTLERRFALVFGVAYTLWEAGFALWRFWLLRQGHAVFRLEVMDIPPVLGFIWVIIAFARGAPRKANRATSHGLARVFIVPLLLVALNALRSYFIISTTFYHISMSVGILFSLLAFTRVYLSSRPETFPLSVNLAGIILTGSLALFGSIAWLVAPIYAVEFRPDILDRRTLNFTPNDKGGYTVTEASFFFDPDRGEALSFAGPPPVSSRKLSFEFEFFGSTYHEIYVSKFGVLGIGKDVDFRELELNFTNAPAILPLMVSTDFDGRHGGVYWHSEGDLLVITFDQVHGFLQPEKEYTYQIILHSNGNFSLTYNGLPKTYTYHPNDRPDVTLWAMGIKPSQAPTIQTSFTNLPIESGPEGVIYDYHRAFRQYLHRFMLPIAVTIFIVSLILVFSVPFTLAHSLAHPLQTLVNGVENMNNGHLGMELPIQTNDEIGYLTYSFNNLSRELSTMIQELETRVAERTSNLLAANEQLLKLTVAVEQSPSAIIITDLHANIEYVNPAFTQFTGYSLEEVKGKNPRILKSELTPRRVYQEMWAQLTAGHAWRGELINQRKDGLTYYEYTVITPIHDTHGRVTHYAAIKEDVTARIMAEHSLRESEKQYRLLFEMETDAIFIIRNEDGRILQANFAATHLYGYTMEEFMKLKDQELSADHEAMKPATPLPSDQVATIPMRYHRKKDGSIFPVEITARFITWQEQAAHITAVRDITERKKIEEELVKLSITDALTGISNRRYFYIQAEQVFSHAHDPKSASVLMIDIDHFKNVNDTHGHAAGDAILRQVAGRLSLNTRPTDILARYGGEEFVILLPRTGANEAEQIAQRLWFVINSKPFVFEQTEINVTISLGIAEAHNTSHSLDALIHHADKALYKAKQSGRNQWAVWTSVTD